MRMRATAILEQLTAPTRALIGSCQKCGPLNCFSEFAIAKQPGVPLGSFGDSQSTLEREILKAASISQFHFSRQWGKYKGEALRAVHFRSRSALAHQILRFAPDTLNGALLCRRSTCDAARRAATAAGDTIRSQRHEFHVVKGTGTPDPRCVY